MTVHTEKHILLSDGNFHAHNVTAQVRTAIQSAGIREGMALVYCMHATCAVIIIEHEAGILVDLENLLEKLAPVAFDYKHHLRGWDTNGGMHLRSALLGVSVTVPVVAGELMLGSFQEIIVIDMEQFARRCSIVIQVQGE